MFWTFVDNGQWFMELLLIWKSKFQMKEMLGNVFHYKSCVQESTWICKEGKNFLCWQFKGKILWALSAFLLHNWLSWKGGYWREWSENPTSKYCKVDLTDRSVWKRCFCSKSTTAITGKPRLRPPACVACRCSQGLKIDHNDEKLLRQARQILLKTCALIGNVFKQEFTRDSLKNGKKIRECQ